MTNSQFLEQLQAAQELTDKEALEGQITRESIGQRAIIKMLPCRTDVALGSFWIDVHGKALGSDGIAPIFFDLERGAVRGIALWRRTVEN